MDYKAQAIILKTQRLGDADKILRLYCRENGPVQAVAKSSYKINSKLGPKLQILNSCDFLLAKGKNLDIVKEVKLTKSFKNINSSYEALTIACYFLDIVDHVAISDEVYTELYDLLLSSLENLEKSSQDSDQAIYTVAVTSLWDFIDLLGYKPELDSCSFSQAKRGQDQVAQYFDMNNGSIITQLSYQSLQEENPYIDSIREFQPGVFPVLEALDKELIPKLELNEQILIASLSFLNKHLEYCLHKEFKAWSLVEQLGQPLLLRA